MAVSSSRSHSVARLHGFLVTPATRDLLCGHGFDRYTNCREGDRVVLNFERWTQGVPRHGADLETYRRYMINHEIGHLLGQWHELCPGPGRPAPVMQQQTIGLHGYVANPWPYLDGRRYRGPPGTYRSAPRARRRRFEPSPDTRAASP